MKAAELFVHSLANEGVEYVFGVPGEENLALLEALRTSDIKLIVTRHEQAAGFMAATYGRLTGKAGVCLSTLGPGATNLVTAAAFAQLGGMPMLMITGQKPVRASKQGHFQIVDTVSLFRPVTKFTHQLVSGSVVPARVREAFRIAQEERPGAVHLELPEDIAAEDVTGKPFAVTKARRPAADEQAVQQAVDMMTRSKHPLILIGAGANRNRVSRALADLVEKTNIPFFDTQLGKGVVDEHRACYLGTAALSENDYIHCAINHADLIINVGHDVVEKPPFIMSRDSQQVIHINFFSAKVDDVYFPQLEVVGDIAHTLEQIQTLLKPAGSWDFTYYRKLKQYLEEHVSEYAADSRWPMIPQRLVLDVRQVMPKKSIVVLDNGMYKIWFARNYQTYYPNTLLLDNALATMGAGLPMAIASKLLYPKKKVVAVVGDGGFMMNSQELETAVRLELDLVVVIVNDGGFGMIQWKQEAMNYQRFGLEFGNPDFVKYADSYGGTGHKIENAEQFAAVLQQSLSDGGVHVIDLAIDYSENHRVFHQELQQKTCNL